MPSVSSMATATASSASSSAPSATSSDSGAIAPLTPVEEPDLDPKLRSPKRQSSTVYEKVCAKLSRSGLKASISSPSLKKAPLATEDLDDLEDDQVQVVHLRPQRSHVQRRCHSEVTPKHTAELLAQFVASRTLQVQKNTSIY